MQQVEPTRSERSPKALYIHIPFCSHKCYYCDFTAYQVDGQPVDQYLWALEKEMELMVEAHPPVQIHTIFIGGGTPTVLTQAQMQQLLQMIDRYFPHRSADLEFTVEANPESSSYELLEVMRSGGVNRISFGVQTFRSRLLKEIGRIHGVNEVLQSVQWARQLGIENISLDLMFGLPKQTVKDVEETIEQAIALTPKHISGYSLKVEEGTLFHYLQERGQLSLPSEDEEFLMYQVMRDRFKKAGYEQYEISNFALPGYESQHNSTYWKNETYYGLGTGAHGYLEPHRYANVKGIQAYIESLSKGHRPIAEQYEVTPQESMENFMILGLRLREGVEEHRFRKQFGISMDQVFGETLEELMDRGFLIQQEGKFTLTEQGLLFGNEVFASFLTDVH